MEQQALAWVGVDVGKTHHWVCAVDEQSTTLASRKIANDEAEITAAAAALAKPGRELVWAIDIIGAPSALLLAVLARDGHQVHYASGRVVPSGRSVTASTVRQLTASAPAIAHGGACTRTGGPAHRGGPPRPVPRGAGTSLCAGSAPQVAQPPRQGRPAAL